MNLFQFSRLCLLIFGLVSSLLHVERLVFCSILNHLWVIFLVVFFNTLLGRNKKTQFIMELRVFWGNLQLPLMITNSMLWFLISEKKQKTPSIHFYRLAILLSIFLFKKSIIRVAIYNSLWPDISRFFMVDFNWRSSFWLHGKRKWRR